MSDVPCAHGEEPQPDPESSYRAPPEKSLNEIIEADKDDASLQKYKETLLGSATKVPIVVDADQPSTVIVKKLTLLVDGREGMELDLSGRPPLHRRSRSDPAVRVQTLHYLCVPLSKRFPPQVTWTRFGRSRS